MDPAVSGHEFEPRTRSTPQMRIRVAQGKALCIERGEPLLPGDVLELAGADRGKVDMQGADVVGFRRRSCRYAVMRLNPTADLVVIGGDAGVRSSDRSWLGESRIGSRVTRDSAT